jgi:hypothetical protein
MRWWVLCLLMTSCGYHLRGFVSEDSTSLVIEPPTNESLHPTVAALLYRELVMGGFQRKGDGPASSRKLQAVVREVSVRPGNGATIVDALPQVTPGQWYALYPVQTDTFIAVRVGFQLLREGAVPLSFERVQEQSVRIFQSEGEHGAFAPPVQRSLVDRALKGLLRDMVEDLRIDLELAS